MALFISAPGNLSVFLGTSGNNNKIEDEPEEPKAQKEAAFHAQLLRERPLAEPLYVIWHLVEKGVNDSDITEIMAAELSISVLWLSKTL